MNDHGAVSGPLIRTTSLLRRYEVILATLAAIVVMIRLAGGGFVVGGGQSRPSVTPFGAQRDNSALAREGPPSELPVLAPAFPYAAGEATPPVGVDQGAARGVVPPYDDAGSFGEAIDFATVPAPGAPAGLAIGPQGDAWVGTDNGGGRGAAGPARLFQFGPDGTLTRTLGPAGAEAGITALAFGPSGMLFAASRSPASVLAVDPDTGATTAYATIPDVLPCVPALVVTNCDGSPVDQPPVPSALAFDAKGALFVADAGQAAIWRVPLGGGAARQWVVDGTWANPTRSSGPAGLAFDGGGNLVIAVSSLLSEDTGVVYLQQVGSDGSAGRRTELARTGASSRPTRLALGLSGRVYVSLAGVGRILVLGPDGKQIASTPDLGTTALDTPVGIAFRGRSLLVASQAPGRPDAGRIVRLPVGESGGRLA